MPKRLRVLVIGLAAACLLVACESGTVPGEDPRTCRKNGGGEWLSYGCIRLHGVLLRADGTPIHPLGMRMQVPRYPAVGSDMEVTYAGPDQLGRVYLEWYFLFSGWSDGDTVPVRVVAGGVDSLELRIPFTPFGKIPPIDTLRWVPAHVP